MFEYFLDFLTLGWLVLPFLGFSSPDPPPPPPQPTPPDPSFTSGQTQEEEDAWRVKANTLLDYLHTQGMTDDAAAAAAVALQNARGDDLAQAVNRLAGLADNVQNSLIAPEDLRAMSQMFADHVQQNRNEGLAINFMDSLNAVNDRVDQEMPHIQEAVQQARAQLQDVSEQGNRLGEFDADRFERAYQPAINRLLQTYDQKERAFNDEMQRRGLTPQGSLDATGNPVTSESAPWNEGRSAIAREFSREAGNVMQEAQNTSDAQARADYQARAQAEPGIGAANITAAKTPFQTLLEQNQNTTATQDANLRLHAARTQDTALEGQTLQNTQAEQNQKLNWALPAEQAAQDYYQSRLADTNAAFQRRSQTFDPYLSNVVVPQTQRLGTKAGVATSNYQTSSALYGQMAGQLSNRAIATQQQNAGLIGAGLGTVGTLISSEVFKDNIADMTDDEYEKALETFDNIRVKHWTYKEEIDPSKKPHTGVIVEDLPEHLKGPDGKTIDVINYLGELTAAVKELSGFRKLLMEVAT